MSTTKVSDEGRSIKNTCNSSMAAILILVIMLPVAANVFAGINLSCKPTWQIYGGGVMTGVGWADFDGNGWNDLALSNGLDLSYNPNKIYFNSEDGLSTTPGWVSDDLCPSGLLYIGDLNNDDMPDMVVPWLGSVSSGFQEGPHAIYLNTGSGLPTTPNWTNSSAHGFSCAVGDVDGDGDLDVAFAQGSYAATDRRKAVIYYNNDGDFGETPGWESDVVYYGVDCAFVDIDLDGDLDFMLSGRTMGMVMFYNNGGVLETMPSWTNTLINGGRQIAFGDINGDEYPDLVVANVGIGYYLYLNNAGTLLKTPAWSNMSYSEPCCLALADADGDGDLDMAVGSWYGSPGVFENIGGTFSSNFAWSYSGQSNTQQVAWGDYDNDNNATASEGFVGNGVKKVFYLDRWPFNKVTSVEIDGTPLSRNDYCYDPMTGWVSLATAPGVSETLTINYTYSNDLELAVTNLDYTSVFENRSVAAPGELKILLLQDQMQGANYDLIDQSNSIKEQIDGFGWVMTTAGLTGSLSRCGYSASIGLRSLTTDLLISDVTDVTEYDIVCLLPSYNGLINLKNNPGTLQLLNDAADAGLVVAAWCRAVRVLAEADLIDGLNVVGHADYSAEYAAAGATYLGNNHPPIIQGNIVTSVRSSYYRTAMCEAMARALPPKFVETGCLQETPTQLDSLTILSQISDFAPLDTVMLVIDTGNGFFEVGMFDDGLHNDEAAGDSLYGAILPPISEGTEVVYYVRAVEDTIHTTIFDPADAPTSTYSITISYEMPGLVITEFMASDNNCCVDNFGDYDDWIEIYNTEAIDIDLTGAYLTDDLGATTKCQLNNVIVPAGGYVVLWADNELSEGDYHLSFTLNSSSGSIGLFDADRHSNVVMTTCSYSSQKSNYSYGRLSDISDIWLFFFTPTPGAYNGDYLCGDANTDYNINVLDVVFMINKLYKSGPEANPPEKIDVNSDDIINILDVVKMINFIYKSGPVPTCPL